MNPITQLSTSLINKIAAGEVVERPLSVVKELTENAIDAGAGVITVEIAEGGLQFVRVTDNGAGIAAADLPLAFARHATSKISDFNDLMSVQTLGFRGEALSSIAAVAQVELITKTRDEAAGTRVEIHGGKLLSSRTIGAANGTSITVANLFYNTPARRKFLKKPSAEAGLIAHCLERLALGNPALTLRYINNGATVFQTAGDGKLQTALLNIYGREVAANMAAVDAAEGEMHLTGLIGKPETARGTRKHGSFFINTRYVESRLIARAIDAALKTMLPAGKFPIYALNLSIPADALDVNVHPTKLDVRFAEDERVFRFVENAVRDAMEEQNLIPRNFRNVTRPREFEAPEPQQIPLATYTTKEYKPEEIPPLNAEISLREESPTRSEPIREEATTQSEVVREAPMPEKNFFTDYQVHELIFETFWLVTQGESMFLIDRHAAHERVLYEEILQRAEAEAIHMQALIAPMPLRLTPRERQILSDNIKLFQRFGFEISQGEPPEIQAVPFLMKGPLPASFFTELLDKIDETGFSKNSPYTHKTEIIAMAACKAAIKAGSTKNEAEARELIEQLLRLKNPFTCPHGRPTIIEITKTELERRFKR